MFDVVLDASAVLARLRNESGGDQVAPKLRTGLLSAVNLAEIAGRLMDLGQDERDAMQAITLLGVSVHPLDEALAYRAAALRPLTRHLGLSLGDRACLALALQEGLPVMTADRAWARLEIGVEVRLIR